MAKQYGSNPNVDFASEKLMSFGKSFATLNGQPLLKSEAWYDLDALKAFALTDSAYVGQKVFFVDTKDPDNIKVTHYGIEADGSLKELGAATSGDNKSIVLDDGNVLSLRNFGEKYYKYVTVLDAVESVDKLPADAVEGAYCKVGDVWYIKGTTWGTADKYPADGSNYILVEDGTFPAGLQPKTRLASDGVIELAWYEPSSTTVEGLSEQMASLSETVNTMQSTVSANAEAIKGKVDSVEGKGLSTNDYTEEDKDKVDSVEEGAQVNKIEKFKVNNVEQTIGSDKSVDISVPTKVSQLENDSEFIKSTVENLTNYYNKSETYTQTEVNDLLKAISTLDILVVAELPTENISYTTIYLVAKSDSETSDIYDEYIYVKSTSKWEMIGNTVIDLSNYLQKNGDGSNVKVTFSAAEVRDLPITGESVSVIIGKIAKYLSDLHDVAFSGSYNDLVDKPEQMAAFLSGTLTAGTTEASITIPDGGHYVSAVVRDNFGAQVYTDVEYTGNTVTVSISEILESDLSIIVTYYK